MHIAHKIPNFLRQGGTALLQPPKSYTSVNLGQKGSEIMKHIAHKIKLFLGKGTLPSCNPPNHILL